MTPRIQIQIQFIVLVLSVAVIAANVDASERPNLVILLADDLGFGDVGFNGCQDIPTPNIDSLARDGVRFSNGYSSHPFCSPMRAGLMAGRYQHRFGYVNNMPFDPHNHVMGFPQSEKTIASRLKQVGYRTGMVGKWHLGAASEFHPLRRGFDFYYGFLGGGHDYFTVDTTAALHENYKAAIDDNGKPVAFDGYLTEVLTDEAIRFIDQSADLPYFLYVAYNAPHTPLQAPEDKIQQFESIKDKKRRTYAAMVSCMDDQIGRLLQKIDDSGDRDHTLVVFLSDNGGPESSNGSDNGPFRGAKGDVFEGGIHVPFVMRMPGTLPAGKVFDDPVISFDVSQTALELGHADPDDLLEGVNLVPYATGQKTTRPHDALYWRTHQDALHAVRQGSEKFVLANDKAMLFDLGLDEGESNNLAETHPQRVAELTDAFTQWNSNNQPSFFYGFRSYHEQLRAFHQQLRRDSEATDVMVAP
ncbi:sulfatase-like hydrolase/transferase [Novipirellula artificiosorum]|uniref:Arylsulfatase n=1 Tax=Novipirellula artificiosorum TaxID=2528016 RepID=A0A5C6DB39_9BACT|nr:sulfatase-like hydrolase/transferase [Novipirellula artificiosorum]TWU33375.1 Arylsulfatase precursor [Novipirellula artificiosorum]